MLPENTIIKRELMNIMVTLEKIKKTNNIISAEYFPEDSKQDVGTFIYDIEKHEVIEHKYCQKDSKANLKTYFNKAIKAIEKCIENDSYPETVEYMWY